MLSLVSKSVDGLVRRVRYKQISLRSPAHAQLLLDHPDETIHEHIVQHLCTLYLGPSTSTDPEISWIHDEVYSACLAAFGRKLKTLVADGILLTAHFWWSVGRSKPQDCHTNLISAADSVSESGITRLELYDCKLDLGPNDLRLPAVTHLTLEGVELWLPAPLWAALVCRSSLPSLRSLSVCTMQGGNGNDEQRCEALKSLAPQLVELDFDDDQNWVEKDDSSIWPLFASLTHLRITRTQFEGDDLGDQMANCLELLPNPLIELDISASIAPVDVVVWRVRCALQLDWPSMSKLIRLILPKESIPRIVPGSLEAFRFDSACAYLAAYAEKEESRWNTLRRDLGRSFVVCCLRLLRISHSSCSHEYLSGV